MIVKAKCLFCDAKIEGEQDYMLNGVGLRMDGRCKPKWLIARPEFKWAWNGLGNREFYLCPNHTDDEYYDKAFEWAKADYKTDAQGIEYESNKMSDGL